MFGREALEEIVRKHPDSFPAVKLLENFQKFEDIYHVTGGKWIQGCGSYLFDGQTYSYNPRCLQKQEELYRYAMDAKKVLEVGVYLGHSLLLMLLANPLLEITAIDIDARFSGPVCEYLQKSFPESKIRFICSDAIVGLESLRGQTFDLIHIDADHYNDAVSKQTWASFPLAQEGCLFVFDDYDAVAETVNGFINKGILNHVVTPKCLWRNCVTRLSSVGLAQQFSCCSKERLEFNQYAVRTVEEAGVKGDIVEVGVYKGGSMIAMMRTAAAGERAFWLYDTFEGMTPAGESDKDLNGYSADLLMARDERVKCICPLEEVKRAVKTCVGTVAEDRIRWMVGDICKAVEFPEQIAVLRLDTDFYDSTAFELANFYDRVVPGGFVILDDYGHWQGCKKAVDEFLVGHPELRLSKIDYTGVWFQKPMVGLPVQYISAFFLQNGELFRPVETFVAEFKKLASSGVSIGLYLDTRLRDLGKELEGEFENIRVLEVLDVEKSGGGVLELPRGRNMKKDTEEYFWIQLMKLKLLARAAERADAGPALAWIDFGFFHMVSEGCVEKVRQKLAAYRLPETKSKILNPGCWREAPYALWDSPVWRFCGSFLVGKKELFEGAKNLQEMAVRVGMPRLTWEVNYWSAIGSLAFEWYHANHDESMILRL